jgi:glutamyl-tRNA reductase
MMVGEAQITGQAKEAHEIAHNSGLLGGILDQTFHESFHLAKRIRTETELTRRPVSLVTLVERKLNEHLDSSSAPVLILGAGEMARQALKLVRTNGSTRRWRRGIPT